MKKNICLLIAGLQICMLLVACGHQHRWKSATCFTPKTCIECGITEGRAAEHTWNNATCSAPKTCTECGITEGRAAEHTWKNATCSAPKTCTECGITEGRAAEHSWNNADCLAPKTCTKCGVTEAGKLTHNYSQWEQDSSDMQIRSRYCTICGNLQIEQVGGNGARTNLGSAGSPKGTTLIISVFADELNTGWNFETREDRAARALMLKHMESATSWLTKQIGTYGVESHFIYDWEVNPDLCYTYDFGQLALVRNDGGGYWKQENYVRDNIPSEMLKEKYKAQNIIYMFYFNTDESNNVNSWTMSNSPNIETEIINVFVRDDLRDSFYYMPASSLAHEIMHCFGAHDLYYASDAIPQAYVDYCKATDSKDIMYTTSLGENIPQLFTRLDAYYMGLVDNCDEVAAWGLGTSSFLD